MRYNYYALGVFFNKKCSILVMEILFSLFVFYGAEYPCGLFYTNPVIDIYYMICRQIDWLVGFYGISTLES